MQLIGLLLPVFVVACGATGGLLLIHLFIDMIKKISK
jgi:hypothetical protein